MLEEGLKSLINGSTLKTTTEAMHALTMFLMCIFLLIVTMMYIYFCTLFQFLSGSDVQMLYYFHANAFKQSHTIPLCAL